MLLPKVIRKDGIRQPYCFPCWFSRFSYDGKFLFPIQLSGSMISILPGRVTVSMYTSISLKFINSYIICHWIHSDTLMTSFYCLPVTKSHCAPFPKASFVLNRFISYRLLNKWEEECTWRWSQISVDNISPFAVARAQVICLCRQGLTCVNTPHWLTIIYSHQVSTNTEGKRILVFTKNYLISQELKEVFHSL